MFSANAGEYVEFYCLKGLRLWEGAGRLRRFLETYFPRNRALGMSSWLVEYVRSQTEWPGKNGHDNDNSGDNPICPKRALLIEHPDRVAFRGYSLRYADGIRQKPGAQRLTGATDVHRPWPPRIAEQPV